MRPSITEMRICVRMIEGDNDLKSNDEYNQFDGYNQIDEQGEYIDEIDEEEDDMDYDGSEE